MHWYSRLVFVAVLTVVSSTALLAQTDICRPTRVTDNQHAAELARVEADERIAFDRARRSWEVKMFSVKNTIDYSDNFRPLCIFGIEVVLQPKLKLVQVKAPIELMAAIEEAVKRLDVPLPEPRSVEITAYVMVVSEVSDPRLMPIPVELQSVA